MTQEAISRAKALLKNQYISTESATKMAQRKSSISFQTRISDAANPKRYSLDIRNAFNECSRSQRNAGSVSTS